jgi:hypothetical protein
MSPVKPPIISSVERKLDGLLEEFVTMMMFTGSCFIKMELSSISPHINSTEIQLTILKPEEVVSLLKDHPNELKL